MSHDEFGDWAKEWKEEMHRHAQRPLVARKLIDCARAIRRTWYNSHSLRWWLTPLYQVRRAHQRIRRGWADTDTWSLDDYITRITGEALLHLRDRGHGYPGVEPWDTPEKWQAYLTDLSSRLLTWNDETFYDDDAYRTTRQAMIEFAQNLGYFWD